MAVTLYQDTDASAPTLDGLAGSLINVLDGCLVNGYGAQPAAGWTKPFSGTNQAAYRNNNATGTGVYLQVFDDASGTAGGEEALCRGYSSMTGISTGSNPFPTAAQQDGSTHPVIRKSNSENATAIPWILVADDRTFYLYVQITSSLRPSYGFGDFEAAVAGDTENAFCGLRNQQNSTSTSVTATLLPIGRSEGSITQSGGKIYSPGNHLGVQGSLELSQGANSDWIQGQNVLAASGTSYPPISGRFYYSKVWLSDFSIPDIRGYHRGWYAPLMNWTSLNLFDTFSDGSATFLIVPLNSVGAALMRTDAWDG